MVKHGFCAAYLHRMFGLKLARAHVRLLNLPSFLVCTCSSSVVLSFVEILSSALLAYHLLVARYEPDKELSVSVCHNSNFDLVNNRNVAL